MSADGAELAAVIGVEPEPAEPPEAVTEGGAAVVGAGVPEPPPFDGGVAGAEGGSVGVGADGGVIVMVTGGA
jgi:hypothetical protein